MGFDELGLRPEVIDALTAFGYEDPTPLQRAAIPVIRRGANVVLRASAGAGVTAAYGAGLVDRLAESDTENAAASGSPHPDTGERDDLADAFGRAGEGRDLAGAFGHAGEKENFPRALVIVPTADRATRVADAIACLAGRTPVRVRGAAPGWRRGPADVHVATADAALRAIRDSSLKLDRLDAFVLDDAAAVIMIEPPDTVDALAVAIPPDTQRIVTAGELSPEVEAFIQAHARRAIEVPPRLVTTPRDVRRAATPAHAPRGSLSYAVLAERDKPNALADLLGRPSETARVVITRTAARAAAVRDQLERRGFTVTDDALAGVATDPEAVAVIGALDAPRATFAYDVPADPRVLERLDPAAGVVFVSARELPHLRRLAAETGFELNAMQRRPPRGEVSAFRERVRRAVQDEDIDAQLLVLDPLFDEFSAAEVAAGLSAILRGSGPAREAPGRPGSPRDASRVGWAAAEPAEPDGAQAEPSRPAPFVRLFVSVGQKDGLRPADIVGAFTGEAKIGGAQIGRIEIRDTFTVVEVESGTAERVIRALNGTTIRGRSLRVDYDRKTTTAPRRAHRPRA